MKSYYQALLGILLLSLTVSCADPASPVDPADAFLGRWEKVEGGLPPVSLEIRHDGNATVGQVWLSGTTYTLPAFFDDSSVVLTNPALSTGASFVGVFTQRGAKMRFTLSGDPDVVVTLIKLTRID
ncbi:MAG: hypothetical protein ABJB74_02875 [Gemmatimonas sp.]